MGSWGWALVIGFISFGVAFPLAVLVGKLLKKRPAESEAWEEGKDPDEERLRRWYKGFPPV